MLPNGSATENVTIADNCFNNISSSSLSGFSSSAIGILQSSSTGTLTGLSIERNTISNVNVNTGTWPTGKIAYGIQINVGGNSGYLTNPGKVINALIKNNEISNLTGFISTGIGLEGNTENAIVENNLVTNLTGFKTADRSGGGYDLNGLKFENNRYVESVTVSHNSFQTNTFVHNSVPGIGYAVSNYVPSTTATLACNWFGTAVSNEIEDNDTFTGKVFNKDNCLTIFSPYLTDNGDAPGIGFQPTGLCDGTPVIIASAVPDHILCGETSGSIAVSWSGGSADYTISWTGGSAAGISAVPYTINGLNAGSYTITVTDTYGSSDVITAEVLYLPVTNTTASTYHPTIQAAIDAATAGDVINVCAGTYTENIVVSKSVTLNGPNANIDPNSGSRVPEAILMPLAGPHRIMGVSASDVSINGFYFQGDNPALTSGILGTNGADLDVRRGIQNINAGINNLKVKHNVFQNFRYFGVQIENITGLSPAFSTGHEIQNNRFLDLGTYMPDGGFERFGGGVLLQNSHYASITDNVMLNVRIGIQTGNFQVSHSGAFDFKIANNHIQTRRRGIFFNLHSGAVTPWTVSNNLITGIASVNETAWDGILISSQITNVLPSSFTGNVIDGSELSGIPTEGIEIWNVKASAAPNISGGSITGVDIGIFANNYEGYSSNGTDGAHAVISGVSITPKTGGVGVKAYDSPSYTGANPALVSVEVKDNCTISGAATGILSEGDDASVTVTNNLATITGNQVGILVKDGADLASVTGNTITSNTDGGIIIESTAGTIGVINNNTISENGYSVDAAHGLGLKNELTTMVDAQNNWWGDASGPYNTPYNTCGLGNAVVGNVDFMPWWTTETGSPSSDLPVYNEDLDTYYCKIQDAIDDPLTLDGHTITVASGTYPENLLVNKELIITGAGAGTTTILAGAGVAVEVTADNVTIEGFEIKHSLVTTLADMGIRLNMSNGSTIQTNKFTSNSLGLQLLDAGSNTIYQNEFAYNAIGIYFEGTTDGINFDGGSNGPFYSLSLNNVVEENNIHHNILIGGQGGQGIYLDAACEENEFINNTISNNAAIGYYAWKASNNTLTGNMIQNNGSEGIQLQGSSDNTITGNTVSGSPVGFWMRSPAENVTNNIITGNTITTNTVGIKMEDDYSTNNWPGILTGNTITGNKISGNGI